MKNKLNINESFVCKIWEGGEAYYSNLVTDKGESIEIIDFGKRNYDSGPDYKDAKVKIGGKTYAGDVEIHRDFKNWEEHNHPKDRKYNSVILHVVLWDSEVKISPKLRIKRNLPTVILANHLNQSIHEIWQDVINKPSDKFKLPCCNLNGDVDENIIKDWFDTLSLERLKMKSERVEERLLELEKEISGSIKSNRFLKKKGLWEQVLYEFIFEALGYSKNKKQMLKLSKSLMLTFVDRIIKNSGDKELLIESLLYGTGGLLFDVRYKDDYIESIKESWKNIEEKVRGQRLNKPEWNFFRLRPQNFPTVRLAYGSQLILTMLNENLFKNIIMSFDSEDFKINMAHKNLYDMLKPNIHNYWSTHHDFGKKSKIKFQLLGKQRINDIIINVIIPVVYFYSNIFKNFVIKSNVLELYNNLKINPENSVLTVINKQVLKNRNVKIISPAREQAAIQLYNFYCLRERCNECKIGEKVFKDTGYEYKIIFY